MPQSPESSPSTPRRSPLVRHTRTQYPLEAIDCAVPVLSVVSAVRFATNNQLQRMIFAPISKNETEARHRATRSLRRLFDSGYLNRIQVFAPAVSTGNLSLQVVNTLSAKGAAVVGMDARKARSRSPLTREVLTHDFWLVELAALAIGSRPPELTITHWMDDRTLAARKRQGELSLASIPDGYFVVQHLTTGKQYPFLIELDLGTESVRATTRGRKDFSRKIEHYLEYLGSPFRQDFGINAPPVVLIVSDSERRLKSLRETTQKLGGGGRYWFATLDQLRGNAKPPTTPDIDSKAYIGPFWASNWQTAQDDGRRSLATRCGA